MPRRIARVTGRNAAKAFRETERNAAEAFRETERNAAEAFRETKRNAAKAFRQTEHRVGTRTSRAAADWRTHDRLWRSPAQVISHWADAAAVDPGLLRHRVRGPWWDLLAEAGITLLVTREYEHFVIGLSVLDRQPHVTYLPLPHPSGLAVDFDAGLMHIASTRNPNQVVHLRPVDHWLSRTDVKPDPSPGRPLVPVGLSVLPGSLYLHDLAMIDGVLHANAVGHNAVVRLSHSGTYEAVWWPRSIDAPKGPRFDRNFLQLNSIAAGADLDGSYFTASAARIGPTQPGHARFPVDRCGVVFGGRTREPVADGLTRPHSARLRRGILWCDNSGYGETGIVRAGQFEAVARLPGWTRGLCFAGELAFVSTSRVIPRFRQYAPGVAESKSECGVHALDTRTGRIVASVIWPRGNQLFAVEAVPTAWSAGFPFVAGARGRRSMRESLFYTFDANA